MKIGPDGVIKKKRGRKPGTKAGTNWRKPGPKPKSKGKGKTGKRTKVISYAQKQKSFKNQREK